MSQQRYTIVLEDGAFKGASLHDGDLLPQPLDVAALQALLPELNASLLSCKEEATAEVAAALAERDATRAFAAAIIAKAEAALSDDRLSEEERTGLLAACVAEAKKPAEQREKEAIQRQIEELQAKLNE